MSDLSAFFKQNKPAKQNEFYPASADFKDADGKPINWELRHIGSRELNKIRSVCFSIKRQGKEVDFNGELYNRMLAAAAVVFPDLKNAALADSYMSAYAPEDRTPENLICLLLDDDREFQALLKKVNEMNGLTAEGAQAAAGAVETAKN